MEVEGGGGGDGNGGWREGKQGANRYDLFTEREPARLNEPARPCKILLPAPMNPISFRHCISRHRQPPDRTEGDTEKWIDEQIREHVDTRARRLTHRSIRICPLLFLHLCKYTKNLYIAIRVSSRRRIKMKCLFQRKFKWCNK